MNAEKEASKTTSAELVTIKANELLALSSVTSETVNNILADFILQESTAPQLEKPLCTPEMPVYFAQLHSLLCKIEDNLKSITRNVVKLGK